MKHLSPGDTVPVADTFDFYVSNKGVTSNNGTTPASPRLSIESVSSLINNYASQRRRASLGLEAGSRFREQFDAKAGNIRVSSFGVQADGKTALISGMDVVTNWRATAGKSNVYESSIIHSVEFASSNYNYLLVAETDTALEESYPVSAVKYLTYVADASRCEATPGSFTMPVLTQNPITVYIHPTAGVPGKNRFRYEVVKRPYGINGFTSANSTYENLFLQSAGNGVGMLAGGENTVVRNVTFQGGGTHHAVIYSGSVDKSLFLPGPKGLADEIGLVFYKPDGLGASNKISRSLFLGIRNAIFTHTNGTSDYHSLSIDSVYAFADTLYTNTMLSSTNNDSVIISNNYCNGYKSFWVGLPHYLQIQNCIIDKISEAGIYLGSDVDIPCNATVSNALITTNSNDANQGLPVFQPTIGFRFAQRSTSLKVSNIIFYGKSTWHTQYATETVFQNSLDNKLEATRNIYICEVNPENYMHIVHTNNATGKGTASNLVSDYNVYIALKGTIYWTAYPNSPQGDQNIFTLKEWQSYTGQDQHSIFIDLRNDPAGLKTIFTDPENGNWTLTQSPQADSIRKMNAGMLTPPLYYPLRPTYEDALDHTLPGGLSYFTGARELNRQVKLEWKTMYEPNLAYFGIESGTDKINFTRLLNVGATGRYKDNLYTPTFADSSYTPVYYRLRLVNRDSSFTYSPVISIIPSKKDSIINGIGGYQAGIVIYPNPVQSRLTIEHPAREQSVVRIYDYSGRVLKQVQVQSSSLTTLSLAGFAAGKYIVEWTSGQEKKALSFVKGK